MKNTLIKILSLVVVFGLALYFAPATYRRELTRIFPPGSFPSVQIHKISALGGNIEAQSYLGSLYTDGTNPDHVFDQEQIIEPDLEEGFRWNLMAAENGHHLSMLSVGYNYLRGEGVQKNPSEAFSWLKKFVELETSEDPTQLNGFYQASYEIGTSYFNGDEVIEEDKEKAISIFKIAANNGWSKAQYALGMLLKFGEHIEQDSKEAVKWLTKAAQQGHERAQYLLGLMYEKGEGIPKNYKKAMEYYELAMSQGNAGATNAIGLLYQNGTGVIKDSKKAFEYFVKAAELGDLSCQIYIADIFSSGLQGVADKNLVKAYTWYSLALASGESEAEEKLVQLKNKLTNEQISAAQTLATEKFDRINSSN